MRTGDISQLPLPPRVALDRQNDIRIVSFDEAQQSRGVSVGHQHIGEQQAESSPRISTAARLHLSSRQARVWVHAIRLIQKTSARRGDENVLPCARLIA